MGQRLRQRIKKADVHITYSGHSMGCLEDWLYIFFYYHSLLDHLSAFVALVVLWCDLPYAEATEKKVFKYGRLCTNYYDEAERL